MEGNTAFYEALTRRDKAADGVFFYAVTSTGVYCRPSCPARNPSAANTAFYPSAAAAEAAGFRPCKRCRPDGAGPEQDKAALVTAACRRIESAEAAVPLAALAAGAGVSAFHFHRIFRAVTGVTPKGYFEALRAKRVRAALGEARSVTEAVYDSGYESSGPFYAGAKARLGMAPAAYAKGGAGERIFAATAPCSLGFVLVARTARGICAIALGDDAAALRADVARQFPLAVVEEAADAALLAQVVALVDGKAEMALPLDIRGTAFQQRVWAALQKIPARRTASYAEIASGLGVQGGARAVAGACAANTLAVAVPCHRVVRGNGDLAGYRWGVGRKRALLAREGGGG